MFNVPDTSYLRLQGKQSAAAGLDVKSETCMKWDDEHHLKMLTDFQSHERKSIFLLLLEYSIHLALFFLSVSGSVEELIFHLTTGLRSQFVSFSSFDYIQQPSSWKFTASNEFQ